MEFRDRSAQYQHIKNEIDAGIQATINGSALIVGTQVEELETKLAECVGAKHCIS